jgi:hypothetical protein
MLSILLAFGGVVAVLAGPKAATSAVASAVPLGLFKKTREQRRNMRLGINTEYAKDQAEKAMKLLKSGKSIVPINEDDTFEPFQFKAHELPESMHWLLKIQFVVTEEELFLLLAMARRQMMDSGEGPFAEATEKICNRYGIDYKELANHSRLLSGTINYGKLIWFSENRLADPTIGKKMAQTG